MVEMKYMEACFANYEDIWIQNLLRGLFDMDMEATMILCDNHSCIEMTKNPFLHAKSKHIEIRYHYICDMM
jgi:hypothetical protein